MRFDVKQSIIDRLRATKRENIETVIDYLERHGFFTYHCHRHHHYDGGLADHAWQTYQIAQRLDAERCASNPNAQKSDEDSIAICALLHDLCDCTGLREISGHGRRSAKMLKEIGFKLTQEEFLAIRFHMSLKDKEGHPLYDDAKKSQLRYIVHKADGISAHLHNGCEDPDVKQENDEDFAAKFVSALETLGIAVVNDETKEKMEREELIDYLNDNMDNEIMENTDFSGIDALKLKVVAVNNEHNAILYEEHSGVECNGCNPLMLKEFFPDYQYDFYKEYFIRINGEFYDGDNLEDYIWNYLERKNELETFGYKVGDKYPLPTTAYLQYLEEDGDPDLYKNKYYDATIRYITPDGSFIVELEIGPALIADASFDIMIGKEINEHFPDANLDNDKQYYVVGFEDSPIF